MSILQDLNEHLLVEQVSSVEDFKKLSPQEIIAYAGFDPTADSLHVGNLVPLITLSRIQKMGGKVILLFGGATGLIGDPSGKTEARQLLDENVIQNNINKQVSQALKLFSDPNSVIVVNNAEWSRSINYIDFLREIGSVFSVNKMLAAEGYKQRLEKGLSFLEFNYQLFQAYDFLILNQKFGCNLQVGGNDQWGNILAGIDLVRRKTENQVFGLTQPLLLTSKGQKMGKTHKGAVWLDEAKFSNFDFYQYWLNCSDEDVERFTKIYTNSPNVSFENKIQAKEELAALVTTFVRGISALKEAMDATIEMKNGDYSSNEISVVAGAKLVDILVQLSFAKNKGQARSIIKNGVLINQEKITDEKFVITETTNLKVGKNNIARLTC